MRGFKLGKGEDKVMADARPSRVAGNYLAHWQDLTSASFAYLWTTIQGPHGEP
jgi:hypothetical protein